MFEYECIGRSTYTKGFRTMSRELWKHQIKAIQLAEANPNFFLAMEQGTGKTRSTIEILRRRYAKRSGLIKTLIVCPVIVCDNWKKEFAMFSKVNQKDIIVLTAAGSKRCDMFLNAVGDTMAAPKIIITNYQGLLIDKLYNLLSIWKPEVLICDESHRLKNHSSKTAKKIMHLADMAQQKLLLTGTPILNSPSDLWMQFRVLDGGDTFGKNYFSFRSRYFKDANAGMNKLTHFPNWVPQAGAFEEIKERIKPKMFRVLKKECLDLPPLMRQVVLVSMSPEQRRMYNEMKNEYLTYIKDLKNQPRPIAAQLAITKALRLQQILTGFAKGTDDTIHRVATNPRLEALENLLEVITPSSKVIVWACFKENYKAITELCDKMKIGYAQIHGDISHAKRIEEMDRFRSDAVCRVMVANQSAGGSGINLVEASYCIYFSKGFSLEADLQSEARNHRGGSEIHEKITRIDLVCAGTIDEHINEALSKKQNISDSILNWSI